MSRRSSRKSKRRGFDRKDALILALGALAVYNGMIAVQQAHRADQISMAMVPHSGIPYPR